MIDRIATERLDLRPLTLGDVVVLYELDSDPEVMRYTLYGRPSTLDEVEATVRDRIGRPRWMGYERATGDFVGWYTLVPHDPGEYEIGYRLRAGGVGEGPGHPRSHAGPHRRRLRPAGARPRIWAQTMAVNTPGPER